MFEAGFVGAQDAAGAKLGIPTGYLGGHAETRTAYAIAQSSPQGAVVWAAAGRVISGEYRRDVRDPGKRAKAGVEHAAGEAEKIVRSLF